MNGFLPANIGTFVSLLMYVALIRGSTFPGVLGATLVQKIFYTVIGVFVYLYLFVSVPGTFNLQLGIVDDHRAPRAAADHRRRRRWSSCSSKMFWGRIKGLWEKAKQGGAILSNKRDYVVKVLLPSFGSWVAKLAVVADLPRGLQHSGHLPHDHVGHRRQLAREHASRSPRAVSASPRP